MKTDIDGLMTVWRLIQGMDADKKELLKVFFQSVRQYGYRNAARMALGEGTPASMRPDEAEGLLAAFVEGGCQDEALYAALSHPRVAEGVRIIAESAKSQAQAKAQEAEAKASPKTAQEYRAALKAKGIKEYRGKKVPDMNLTELKAAFQAAKEDK